MSCQKNKLEAVHKIKEVSILSKPAYVGMRILDLRKMLMYDFNYCYIKNKCGDKDKLLFTDTDSLVYKIETRNVHGDFYVDK